MRISIGLVLTCLVLSGGCRQGVNGTRSGYLRGPGGKLYYETHYPWFFGGAEWPPAETVVLLHGGMMDRRMWDEQIPALCRRYRVVAYDLRGFGRSSSPTLGYANEADLHAMIEHLHLERPHIVGLSLGGATAIDYALLHPDRVASLVLVAPGLSGFEWAPETVANYYDIIAAARDRSAAQAADLWLSHPYMQPASSNPSARERIRRILVENGASWLMNPLLERPMAPPAAQRLGEIRSPTTVIVGDRDIADIQKICDQIVREVPGARKVVVPGAGHIVNMEQPEAFIDVLLRALRSAEIHAMPDAANSESGKDAPALLPNGSSNTDTGKPPATE